MKHNSRHSQIESHANRITRHEYIILGVDIVEEVSLLLACGGRQ